MTTQPNMVDILLVEDDPTDQLLLQQAVETNQIGNTLICCSNGVDAQAHLTATNHNIGLIILDWHMPIMDGQSFLGWVKNQPKLSKIPLIVLTNSNDPLDIETAYEMGASSYIAKPVTLEKLVHAVKTIEDYWLSIVTLPRNRGQKP